MVLGELELFCHRRRVQSSFWWIHSTLYESIARRAGCRCLGMASFCPRSKISLGRPGLARSRGRSGGHHPERQSAARKTGTSRRMIGSPVREREGDRATWECFGNSRQTNVVCQVFDLPAFQKIRVLYSGSSNNLSDCIDPADRVTIVRA